MIDCSKCIHSEVCANRYANDGREGICGFYLQDNTPTVNSAKEERGF
jgi:hypothetical protein